MEISINLSNSEYKDLKSYCDLNGFEVLDVIKRSYLDGFRIEKYGLLSGSDRIIEKEIPVIEEKIIEIIKEVPVIKEKIIEIIKEVPVIEEKIVEVIKEVEKVIEVPVEVIKEVEKVIEVPVEIIKEVPIEKIVYITDEKEIKEKMSQKESEFETERQLLVNRINELENIPPEIIEKEIHVPVEVIKEVYIEKPQNNDKLKGKMDLLQKTIQNLKNDNIDKDRIISEYEKTINEFKQNNNKPVVYLRNSNLEHRLKK
jgi:hypothetical protein